MNFDLTEARHRLRRTLAAHYKSKLGRGLNHSDLEDMEQNAFVALYGLHGAEWPSTDDELHKFLVKKADVDSRNIRKHERAESSMVEATSTDRGNSEIYTFQKARIRPTQEDHVDALIALAVVPLLPAKTRKVAELLIDGASPIECARESGLRLIDVMRTHRSVAELINRILDDQRQERRDLQRPHA